MAGAVRSGLALLAAWRACPGPAGQCRVRRRPCPGGGVAVGAERDCAPDDWSADHAASPVAARVIGAVEREVSRGAEPDVLYPGEAKDKPRPGDSRSRHYRLISSAPSPAASTQVL